MLDYETLPRSEYSQKTLPEKPVPHLESVCSARCQIPPSGLDSGDKDETADWTEEGNIITECEKKSEESLSISEEKSAKNIN